MDKPSLVFWQNMPAHHQVGALDSLGRDWGAPVMAVWCEDISPLRRSQGWPSLERPHLVEVFLPQVEWRAAVDEVIRRHPDAVHVFSGIGAYPQVSYALERVEQAVVARYVIMAESPVMLGWRGPLRRFKSAWNYWPRRRRMLGLLAMGRIAEKFYAAIGIPENRIYPYAYQSPFSADTAEAAQGACRLVYFGQLSHRKGVDTLLKSLAGICAAFQLDVIGDGPERTSLEALALSLGLDGKVNFMGTLPSAELQRRLPSYALSIVPSRFDGWGMAVNESLQAGLPVLVSDRVGAAELVQASGAGEVYPMGSAQKLAEFIQARLLDPSLLSRERTAALAYRHKLQPSVIGGYLKDSLEHMIGLRPLKPSPPWRK
jgi:glycosyltransferase involved in cell wall biosynthesis